MSNHAHRVSRPLCAHGQAMSVNFRAANVAGQVLMCEIVDLQGMVCSGFRAQPSGCDCNAS